MKQDTKGRELLRQIVDETPQDLKTQFWALDYQCVKTLPKLKKNPIAL